MREIFTKNWPRKAAALLTAIVVWFLVNQTLTATRTLPEVAVHIINLPQDKTVIGLMSHGILNKRIALTVTGKSSAVEDLSANDIEVVIDAAQKKESWIATIDKKSLNFLNPELKLKKNIHEVNANGLFIQLSNLITEEIPVTITKPVGDPPKGYRFLDVWPKYLMQKVTGPEEQVHVLKKNGLDVTFNLSRITEDELDALRLKANSDEFCYFVPQEWKTVAVSFNDYVPEMLNDPRSDYLRIDFLKQELIPLEIELPITIFFPVQHSRTINPQTYSLKTSDIVQKKNGLKRLTLPLYVKDVSQLFLDIVRDHLLLVIIASPKTAGEHLQWALEFIDEKSLEDAFTAASFKGETEFYSRETIPKLSEKLLRERFREYRNTLSLLKKDGTPLHLLAELEANMISLKVKEE